VALACEVVSEDHITRSKTARGAIADPDFHLPHENKNVLSPGRGVPIAPIVRRETAEHEVGTRLKRNVVALLGRQREIFKMGLAVVARIYPYDHARAPSHREIIVHAKAYSASSPTTKPLASLLRTLPPDKSVANGISSKVTASSSACKQSAVPLAIGFGEGAELRRPLGITIVGGLVMSQLLTLCTTPVIYLCLDHLRLWVRRPARIRQPRLADERLPEPGE
jgi:hypothetical protein